MTRKKKKCGEGVFCVLCVVWYSSWGVCVERYVIGIKECFGNQFTTMVICVRVPECAFTSPEIMELYMLVMYCMQFVMSVSVVSMVSWCFLVLCICWL